MSVTLLSLNIGQPKVIGQWRGEAVVSGIDKRPLASGTVFIGPEAISGDHVIDGRYHGGADKAVYAYPAAHWDWWLGEKDLACRPGLFGENLTIAGLDETEVRIGDRFSWGEVVLEVSQPRGPCFKLDLFAGKTGIAAAMTLSGRCGWYLRVVQPGEAPVNGILTRQVCPESPTVREAFTAVYARTPDNDVLHRIKLAPRLAADWQQQIDKRLAAAKG